MHISAAKFPFWRINISFNFEISYKTRLKSGKYYAHEQFSTRRNYWAQRHVHLHTYSYASMGWPLEMVYKWKGPHLRKQTLTAISGSYEQSVCLSVLPNEDNLKEMLRLLCWVEGFECSQAHEQPFRYSMDMALGRDLGLWANSGFEKHTLVSCSLWWTRIDQPDLGFPSNPAEGTSFFHKGASQDVVYKPAVNYCNKTC